MIGMTVCSGIGAPEVSAPWIDWRYQSEIEKFPCAVLAHRFPEATNLGDMTKFEEWPDATVDVLCGGTPCQSFSVAGLRKGLDDPRGNLMLTYLAIARRYRPRWLVWENVPGVLSSNGGRDFGSLLGGVGALGYGFSYRVLDAQYVRTRNFPRAVPQRRRRVFVVGYLGDWRRAAAVLFDGESLSGNSAPRRETRQVAPTIPSRSLGGGGLGTDFDCDGGLIAAECAPTLNAHFGDKLGLENQHINGGCGLFVTHALRGEGFDASEDGTGRGTPIVPVAQGVALRGREGGGTAELTGPISPALRASTGGGDKPHVMCIQERAVSENPDAGPGGAGVRTDGASYTLEARTTAQAVAFSCKDYGADATDEASPTMRAMGHGESHANAGGQIAVAFDTTQVTSKANYSNPKPGGPCHPLAAGAHPPAVAFAHQAGGKQTTLGASDDGSCMTLASHQTPAIATPWAVRRLTVTECSRLQGFPDDWTRIPWRGKPAEQCPDGPQYKALGNSWAVNCGEWIFDRIRMVEEMTA